MTRIRQAVLACAVCFSVTGLMAQESRQLNRIPTPSTAMQLAPSALPPGARRASTTHPVSPRTVETAVRQIASAWNTTALRPLLERNFLNRERLLEALRRVPRDAKLRVLAIEGIRTLEQWIENREGAGEEYVSRVSATVRTQVEFNDPRGGLQRLDGTNELVLLVREPLP